MPLIASAAIRARVVAERGDDPEKYEEAAKLLELLDLNVAAARCRERAAHYAAEPATSITSATAAGMNTATR